MKQKIEWYKEVLELEPGSRIFFPLAKLLAAEGNVPDAVLTLKQGLGRHPDHLEARLMLVEMLSRQNNAGEAEREVDDLGALFAAYPGFWQAWSERLFSVPAMRDASLAMRFFSAALEGKKLNWGMVIEKGLHALLQEDQTGMRPPQDPSPDTFAPDDDLGIPAVPEKGIAEALSASRQTFAAEAEDVSFDDISPDDGPGADKAAEPPARAESPDDDGPEEAFSLRTRSMAEVLADQGDYASAAEIYQELLQAASEEEKPALRARLDELSSRLGTDAPAEAEKADDKAQNTSVESTRLVGLLESLAQRLEDRTR